MTYTPNTIHALRSYLEAQGMTCSVARSCDPSRHFYGYHLGKDQIFSTFCKAPDGTNRALGHKDYSIQTDRDKLGLTDARSAIDIEEPSGKLQEFSKWLVEKCMKERNRPKLRSNDIREIIYSPDGKTVWRYDDVTGENKIGGGDNSHLWHTHVSFYRDSEERGKIRIFSPFFS